MTCRDTLWGLCRQQFQELPSTEFASCFRIRPGLWTLSALCLAFLSSPWRCKDQRCTYQDDGICMPCLSCLHWCCTRNINLSGTRLIPQASKSWSSEAHCFSMSCLDWAKAWKDFTKRNRLEMTWNILKLSWNLALSSVVQIIHDNPTEDITQMTQHSRQGWRTLRATTCQYVPVRAGTEKLASCFWRCETRFRAWVHRSAAFGPGGLTWDFPKTQPCFSRQRKPWHLNPYLKWLHCG